MEIFWESKHRPRSLPGRKKNNKKTKGRKKRDETHWLGRWMDFVFFWGGLAVQKPYFFPKFNSSPLKSYRNPIGKQSSNHHFSGTMLNFGGVTWFKLKSCTHLLKTTVVIPRWCVFFLGCLFTPNLGETSSNQEISGTGMTPEKLAPKKVVSKKVTTHTNYRTPHAIPLPNYERIPFTACW